MTQIISSSNLFVIQVEMDIYSLLKKVSSFLMCMILSHWAESNVINIYNGGGEWSWSSKIILI